MESIESKSHIKLSLFVQGQQCLVEATFIESINFSTGDSYELVSLDSITNQEDGQMIAPKMLSAPEFRQIVQAIKLYPTKKL